MPSSLTIRQVCSRRPKAGQLEDFFRVLAFLGVAVGNFCRRARDFRENRGREHPRRDSPRRACYFRALKLGGPKRSIVLVAGFAGFGAAFLGERFTAAN